MRPLAIFAVILVVVLPERVLAQPPENIDGFYDAAGVSMYLRCEGNSPTTLVIDGGAGSSSVQYQALQVALSGSQRVCIYDRAGLGASEVSPMSRTSDNMARELHALLLAADIEGPIILLGRSLGGYNIRAFQTAFPELVAGLIFVDSAHPEQWDRLPASVAQLVAFGAAQYRAQAEKAAEGSLDPAEFESAVPSFVSGERRRRMLTALATPTRYITAAEEFESARQSAQVVQDSRRDLDIPVAVLTASHSFEMYADFYNEVSEANAVWLQLQSDLVLLSNNAMRTQIDASHNLTDTHVNAVAAFTRRAIIFIESSDRAGSRI